MSIVDPGTAAVLGAGCSILGTAVYLWDVRHGGTRPHRGSWLVWAVVGVVAALSHGAEGGRWSLLVLWTQAVMSLLVLALAVPFGIGRPTAGIVVLLGVAAAGVTGWVVLDDPLAATVSAVVADAAGILAMLPKSWADPWSEGVTLYALVGVTGVLSMVAADEWSLGLLLFPAYLVLVNPGLAAVLLWRRRRLARDADGAGGLSRPAAISPRPAAPPVPVAGPAGPP